MRLVLAAAAGLGLLIVLAAAYVLYVYDGVRAGAPDQQGVVSGLGVVAPVRIVRDARGFPHVTARNEHDLFFAEGYLQGCDRLFQLDVYRRLVAGRLSEIFGSLTLASDEAARTYDVAGLVADQERLLSPRLHANAQAFADGINAAIRARPLPPEFRALVYRPQIWTVRDVLTASFSTVLALTDSWNDVLMRSDVYDELGDAGMRAFFPITDPVYDSPAMGSRPALVPPLPALDVRFPQSSGQVISATDWSGSGSNNFTAGAARTVTGRALLANDPHLALHIPGVWYVADLEAPGIHVAGATLAGAPGIILGHNAHIAWGATNGTVATVRVYRERFRSATSDEYLAGTRWLHATHRTERFLVRFKGSVDLDYLRTRHGFVFASRGTLRYAAAWTADLDRRSAFAAFDGLDRAQSASDAMQVLSRYPGPPQNFVLADDKGNAGYVLAGDIPVDSAWGRWAHDGPTSGTPGADYVPFGSLPAVTPSRTAVAFTANDRVYGARYPYRLSAEFEPPYRAARIKAQLSSKRRYDIGDFSSIQADVLSLPERDLARAAVAALRRASVRGDADLARAQAALASFDGRMGASSRGAVYVWALRETATAKLVRMHLDPNLAQAYLDDNSAYDMTVLVRALRERPSGWVPRDDYDGFLVAALRDAIALLRKKNLLDADWGKARARVALHPFAAFGFHGWDGPSFPGNGSAFSPHVQGVNVTQSFRAVWDVGNWNAGGLVIPLGESGQPGNRHYRDLAGQWLGGALEPLPFGPSAVARSATETLDLRP